MNYCPASILTLHGKDAVSPYLLHFFNTLMCLGICIARCLGAHIEKKCNNSCNCQGSDVLAMPHLSLYDQICALQLLFVMHLVVMICADKNFTDTNHLNQYPSF